MLPGEVVPGGGPVEINAGLPVREVPITNTGPWPVHLTAHFHVFEANPCLRFDRRAAYGMRLDVPASGSVRIEPGATVTVRLVPIGGARIVRGFNAAVDGPLDETSPDAALARLVPRGIVHEE